MRLQLVSLHGRKFRVQFSELMGEFGGKIPWLQGLADLEPSMGAEELETRFLKGLNLLPGEVMAYQLIDRAAKGDYRAGILVFKRSPEKFRDHRLVTIAQNLDGQGACYASGLQVAAGCRGRGLGTELMQRLISRITARHQAVWGVVADPKLVGWYQSLGAEVLGPVQNLDELLIVHWPSR